VHRDFLQASGYSSEARGAERRIRGAVYHEELFTAGQRGKRLPQTLQAQVPSQYSMSSWVCWEGANRFTCNCRNVQWQCEWVSRCHFGLPRWFFRSIV
jgi:hypothetical protein